MKRLFYIGYYLKNLDRKKLALFINHINDEYGIGRVTLIWDMFFSAFVYKVSLLEYFQFRFYGMEREKRRTYAGTGFMYEYQLVMNPPECRIILDDKRLFYKNYGKWIKHFQIDIDSVRADQGKAKSLFDKPGDKLVFKAANGKCGKQVLICEKSELSESDLARYMGENKFDLVEEFIVQHPRLSELSPSAVNTVRIFTQLNASGQVELLGCRLRISINNKVDNLAAGNIAAAIDDMSGIVTGPGIYSDITKPDEYIHPITGTSIIGFQIPYWQETVEMVMEAALAFPQNRSVGWDVAITEAGPDLIEGNHDWCKLVYQLPVKQGLKPVLDKHLNEYLSIKSKTRN